jgi:uncharacterized membrane protein YfcA
VITDPYFYAVAIPAVILFGLSKSGLAAALSIPCVPLIALAVSPLDAAAILLPIIIAMDATAVWRFRGSFDRRTLWITIPTGILGIGIGWLLAAYITEAHVRLIIGLIAVWFALNYWFGGGQSAEAKPHNPIKGRFWSTVSGFTSFLSHSGGVPFQMYTLPMKFEPMLLVGTGVIFFAVINAVKLVPYFALGFLSTQNLMTSLVLSPLAPLSILAGAWLVSRIPTKPFYQLTYLCVLIVGLKMLWDGGSGLIGG